MSPLSRRQMLGRMAALGAAIYLGGTRAMAFAKTDTALRPIIVGLGGTEFTSDQRAILQAVRPVGVILYRGNIVDKAQLKALSAALKNELGDELLIMIDSEGGKIVRLKPPHWRLYPGASDLGMVASRDQKEGERATYLSYRLMADALAECGINTNLAPVADLRHGETFAYTDYRNFSADPAQVATLARIACEATFEGGVLPVLKHIPGQGRVTVNSDKQLTYITEDQTMLEPDFSVFRNLKDMPLAMVSNTVYTAIDPDNPACLSATVIRTIREKIGFKGLLITDDLGAQSMMMRDRATTIRSALEAGNDVVQYTYGVTNLGQGKSFLPEPDSKTGKQIHDALTKAHAAFKPCDSAALHAELDEILRRHNVEAGA